MSMLKRKVAPSKPVGPMRTVVYYLTRDTNCVGQLSSEIQVWYRKPNRCKLAFDKGYVWMPSSLPNEDVTKPSTDLGLYGSYLLVEARAIFKTVPDTDLEIIRCEQNQPAK